MKFNFKYSRLAYDIIFKSISYILPGFLLYLRYHKSFNSFSFLFLLTLYVAVILLLLVKQYGSNPLKLENEKLYYYKFKHVIDKQKIKDISLAYGLSDSFAHVTLLNPPTLKWYHFKKKIDQKKYGTIYRINLDEIKGKPDETFLELTNWKKQNCTQQNV